MIKRFSTNKGINEQIKTSSYNFFSVKSFFGFDDITRFIKITNIFFSFILYLIIMLFSLKRKRKDNSIILFLIINILIINFIHTFAYILNWVTNIDKAYILDGKYKIGGLLIGNPINNYSICQIQGFILLYTSLSQDCSINILFYLINKSGSISPSENIYFPSFGICHFLPFFSLLFAQF